ncbi:MAG: RdgB/HAM1 family non-canonical purine NTP pyrophosphatase [Flavobacteriales bacterium]
MNKDLVFASANENKILEVSKKLGGLKLLGLKDIGCFEEIPETSDTIEGNAVMKARYIFEKYGYNCFADDTGLEVEALGGQPGVHSARYSGEERNEAANRTKLLNELDGNENRFARFKTVICLIQDGKETLLEGIVNGEIGHEEVGDNGFGYDSLFIPLGESRTFAQMTLDEKNVMSHRGLAISKLKKILGSNL